MPKVADLRRQMKSMTQVTGIVDLTQCTDLPWFAGRRDATTVKPYTLSHEKSARINVHAAAITYCRNWRILNTVMFDRKEIIKLIGKQRRIRARVCVAIFFFWTRSYLLRSTILSYHISSFPLFFLYTYMDIFKNVGRSRNFTKIASRYVRYFHF